MASAVAFDALLLARRDAGERLPGQAGATLEDARVAPVRRVFPVTIALPAEIAAAGDAEPPRFAPDAAPPPLRRSAMTAPTATALNDAATQR